MLPGTTSSKFRVARHGLLSVPVRSPSIHDDLAEARVACHAAPREPRLVGNGPLGGQILWCGIGVPRARPCPARVPSAFPHSPKPHVDDVGNSSSFVVYAWAGPGSGGWRR
eukprot:11210351-Lingulodinium_polyedra.AAC.1